MRRYVFTTAVLFLCGMALCSAQNNPAALAVLFVILLTAAVCIIKNNYIALALCFVIPALGFFVLHTYNTGIENTASPFYNTICRCEGRVENVHTESDYCYADVALKSVSTCDGSFDKAGKVRVNIYGGAAVQYGDTVSFRAKLKKPAEYGYGVKNKRQYLLGGRIGLTAACSSKDFVITGKDFSLWRPFDLGHKIRDTLSERTDTYLSEDAALFIKGFLLGNKSDFTPEIYTAFRKSGVSHIVAVSGFHVSVLIGILMFVFGLFGISRKRAVLFVYIAAAWLLALITGLSPSCVRAACMVTVYFAGILINRNTDPLTSLGLTVCVMLLANPAVFYDMGFRLSVSSVMGILIFAEALKEKLGFLPQKIRGLVAVYFAAQIGVLPVVLHYYGSFSAIGLLSNLILLPLMPAMMLLALVTTAICSIPFAGTAAAAVLDFTAKSVLNIVKALGSVPFAEIVTGRMRLRGYAVYALGAAGLYFFLKGKKNTARYAVCAAVVIFTAVTAVSFFHPVARLSFINVGKADCAVLQADNVSIMVDCGGDKDFDLAATAVIPYLDIAGISKVDVALISHYHTDHCLGFISLMEHGRIKNLVLPRGVFENDMKIKLTETAEKTGTKLYFIDSFDVMQMQALKITAFNSYVDNNENNGMIYYVDYGENRICFTGDVEKSGERKLLSQFNDVRCDILKVAHHGSTTSSSQKFVKAALPRIAVVTRSGDIPAKTQAVFSDYETQVLSTANGNISIDMDTQKILSVNSQRSMEYEF